MGYGFESNNQQLDNLANEPTNQRMNERTNQQLETTYPLI